MKILPAFIRLSGPWGICLLVLAVVVLLLSAWSVMKAVQGGNETGPTLEMRINSVLFWGVASAVLGFLGQCHGVYLALNEIYRASDISLQVVAEGFVISFFPALFGLGILAFASLTWLALRPLR